MCLPFSVRAAVSFFGSLRHVLHIRIAQTRAPFKSRALPHCPWQGLENLVHVPGGDTLISRTFNLLEFLNGRFHFPKFIRPRPPHHEPFDVGRQALIFRFESPDPIM